MSLLDIPAGKGQFSGSFPSLPDNIHWRKASRPQCFLESSLPYSVFACSKEQFPRMLQVHSTQDGRTRTPAIQSGASSQQQHSRLLMHPGGAGRQAAGQARLGGTQGTAGPTQHFRKIEKMSSHLQISLLAIPCFSFSGRGCPGPGTAGGAANHCSISPPQNDSTTLPSHTW